MSASSPAYEFTPKLGIPILALAVLLELCLDHVDHDLVADETSGVHDLLCFPAEGCLGRDLCSQHVSCGLQMSAFCHCLCLAKSHVRDGMRRTSS